MVPSTYRIPTGLVYGSTSSNKLPNAPYKDTTGGVIQNMAARNVIISTPNDSDVQNECDFGMQDRGAVGARGNINGDEYYVENIFEELDYPDEWFYNDTEKLLHYYNNYTKTNGDLSNLVFEATKLKVVLNYTGSMSKPVQNILIDGVTMQDTA